MIALIVDKPNWAYFNIAFQVKLELEKEFGVAAEIIALEKIVNWQEVVETLRHTFSHIHFFWRGATRKIVDPMNTKISTSVYDHHDLEYGWVWDPASPIVRGYWFSSDKLKDEYTRLGLGSASPVLTDGVDTNLFVPVGRQPHRQIRKIGWVGNPFWGSGDHKGLQSIILPALKKLSFGESIDFVICDGSTPHFQMPYFYEGIDLLICASKSEGTPNPILEATSSGVPWISTDVGLVRQISNRLPFDLLYERSVDSLVTKISFMNSMSAQERLLLVDALRTESLEWDWRKKSSAIAQYLTNLEH